MVDSSSMPHRWPTLSKAVPGALELVSGARITLRLGCSELTGDGRPGKSVGIPMGIPTDVWGFKHAKTILKPW